MSVDPRIKPVAAITTAPLFDIVVDLNPKLNIGDGLLGRRILFGAAGGRFEGPRLRGEVVPGGGDWALFRADGAMSLDVRRQPGPVVEPAVEDEPVIVLAERLTLASRLRRGGQHSRAQTERATRHARAV